MENNVYKKIYVSIFLLILSMTVLYSTTLAKVDKDFSLAIEVENNTLDLSDPNLPKGYDEASYYFWVNAVITNESMYPKKLTIWSCSGFGFKIESDSVRSAVSCMKNFSTNILLQPKETYDVPLYLSFKKEYTGDTLKFRIYYRTAAIGWSKYVTIKLRR